MYRTPLVRAPLAIVVLIATVLLAAPRVGVASSIISHVVGDPTGKYNGDVFGCSAAWVGDVNGDGYDDVLIGAFRFPQISSLGRAYLFFGARRSTPWRISSSLRRPATPHGSASALPRPVTSTAMVVLLREQR